MKTKGLLMRTAWVLFAIIVISSMFTFVSIFGGFSAARATAESESDVEIIDVAQSAYDGIAELLSLDDEEKVYNDIYIYCDSSYEYNILYTASGQRHVEIVEIDPYDSTCFNIELWVEDSIVIIDIKNPFIMSIGNQNITDWLLYVFSTLKENGCKTMFICNTDEIYFEDDNEFLDYVDFHINMDVYTYFCETVIKKIERETDFCKTAIVVNDDADADGYNSFVRSKLMPFIALRYETGIRQFLEEFDSDVYYLVGDNTFASLRTGQTMSSGAVMVELEYYDYIYLIGVIAYYSRYDGFSSFAVNLMYTTATYHAQKTSLYTYGTFEIWNTDYYDVWKSYSMTEVERIVYYATRIECLMRGLDCSVYGNWEGRCEVTSKPLDEDGGWIEMDRETIWEYFKPQRILDEFDLIYGEYL